MKLRTHHAILCPSNWPHPDLQYFSLHWCKDNPGCPSWLGPPRTNEARKHTGCCCPPYLTKGWPGSQTGLQSHSVRPSPQTEEALWGWLPVSAVGNNGFPSCGFTDHLATLPTAPQGEKALRRWMMQGAQSRGDTTVKKGELTNPQVFRLFLGEEEMTLRKQDFRIYSFLKGVLGWNRRISRQLSRNHGADDSVPFPCNMLKS